MITDATYVCSLHFKPEDFKKTLTGVRLLKKGAVPSVFPWTQERRRPAPTERTFNVDESMEAAQGPSFTSSPSSAVCTPAATPDHDYADPPVDVVEQVETLKVYTRELEDSIAAMARKKFGIEQFSTDPDLIQFYTGFRTYEVFVATFNALKPTAVNMIRCQIQRQRCENTQMKNDPFRSESIALVYQLFMFLCRVRQGFF